MNNDTRIKELLAKVEEQRKNLGEKPRAAWKTNGLFKGREGSGLNLNTVADKSTLVDALAVILEFNAARKSASEMLGVPFIPSTWNGYEIDDYVQDFKLRIAVLEWEAKKKVLIETEAKLKALVSEEARTEMALDDISKVLG